VTGGLGGVMRAASRGAHEAGGRVIGILPGSCPEDANEFVEVAIATGVGEARNVIIANTADAFIAVSGGWGTLSEMAFALKQGKRVVSLGAPSIEGDVVHAAEPEEAVEAALGD
jgi:uncharacterized protein (TIGR00725 family)